jgi:tripartite-type tricarboxylate transporter receptor subunit TctC
VIRRRALLAVGIAAGLAAPAVARAGKPLTLIVAGAPGSAADQGARAFAPFLERHLPHAVVWVENRDGDDGLAAFRAVAAAEPDGQALGWVATPSLTARSIDRAGTANLLDQLRLVGTVSREPVAFVSAADTPLATAQDLVRRSAEDAGAVPLGTPPAGSPPHLAALRLQALAGTKLNIVAFPSAAAARQAALAGNVAAACLGLGDALEGLRDGRLAGLGIAAHTHFDAFPDMQLLHDSGLELYAFIRRGLAVPRAAPDDVVALYAAALRSVVADPEFVAQGQSDGFAAEYLDGETWTRRTRGERAELAELWRHDPWLASAI